MRRLMLSLLTAIPAILFFTGCNKLDNSEDRDRFSNIFILYSAGKNNLSGLLQRDISELQKGYVPYKGSENACIIVTHSSPSTISFEKYTTPYIIRMYRERKTEEVVMDTLKILSEETMLTKASDMNNILTYIKDNFKADSYGMVFSSHGTGWLPKAYYNDPSLFDDNLLLLSVAKPGPRAFLSREDPVTYDAASIPESPLVKSIGQEYTQSGNLINSYELSVNEFAQALPFKLEYIIFDACLMGGVEVAYGLKDKCNYIAFSPAEVLTDGFDYSKMGSRLMESSRPDPEQVCEDFFDKYKDRTGSQCTATISLVDCSQLDYLGAICKILFADHRNDIAGLMPSEVQQFSKKNYLWFFDLKDILVKAGCADAELSMLDEALSRCIIYKASTERVLNLFDIKTFCGLSMFLPNSGSTYLNEFYKTLDWNKATNLDI